MARVPGAGGEGDFLDRFRKQTEHIRQLRSQKRCHTESKTVIVSGEIVAGLYVGPCHIAINPLNEDPENPGGNNPEFKELFKLPGGSLRAGACTVQWTRNDVDFGAPQDVTTTPDENPQWLDPPIELADGDKIRPVFTAASADAVDYSGSVVMLTVAA